MKCGSCGGYNAYPFYWLGVASVRCDDCGADLMPGVDITEQCEASAQDGPRDPMLDYWLEDEKEAPPMPNAYYRLTLDDGTLDYIGSACDHPETLRSMFQSWYNRTGWHKVSGFEKCDEHEAKQAWGLTARSINPGVIEGCKEADCLTIKPVEHLPERNFRAKTGCPQIVREFLNSGLGAAEVKGINPENARKTYHALFALTRRGKDRGRFNVVTCDGAVYLLRANESKDA